ncbi:MAG: hypothetical protein LBV47_05480 [Bacteroidales bacterium]|jgi:uncharacterized membrane protein|nr:hypothetical protein [Bacteroidales bacterium]
MNGKTKAIVAHITLIGWIIALILNNGEKDEFASYYIRQVLGIMLLGTILSVIPYIDTAGVIISFILWLLSLLGAIQEEEKETPVVGKYFQEWFKGV